MKLQKFYQNIFRALNKEYKIDSFDIFLKKYDTFKMSVYIILSARTTDTSVRKIIDELFANYRDVYSMSLAKQEELEKILKTIGMYRIKSRNLINFSKMIIEKYLGKIPNSMDELIKLPGIGRKTANVILSNIFDIPGFAVDTHVKRVLNRIGVVKTNDVLKIEYDVNRYIASNDLKNFSLLLINHGRKYCKSRKPNCGYCCVNNICFLYNNITY